MSKYNYKELQEIMKVCCRYVKKQLNNSIPKITKKFKLVSDITPYFGDWEFKIITDFEPCFIWHSECVSTMNFVWSFIDALASGEKEAYWNCDQEGTDAVLIAQEIDDKNIRLSLFSDGWYDFCKKEQISFDEEDDENYYMPLKLDIIVNKDIFISTFYAELINGFSCGNKINWNNNCLWESRKMNSDIVISYFANRGNNKLDITLYELLSKDIKEIEQYLKDGFNPNYLEIEEDNCSGTTPLTVLASSYVDINPKKNNTLEQLNKIKLFLDYGAMPNFFSTVHQWDYTPLEKALVSSASSQIIEILLQNGAKDTKICWEIVDDYKKDLTKNTDNSRYYKQIINLFEKYGERTILKEDYSSK